MRKGKGTKRLMPLRFGLLCILIVFRMVGLFKKKYGFKGPTYTGYDAPVHEQIGL